MGIHVLRSFTAGGHWIIQDMLTNDATLERLLPGGVPLSTLRVITASRHGLTPAAAAAAAEEEEEREAPRRGDDHQPSAVSAAAAPADFSVLTVVLRAGRVGAVTDHDCICFPVDSVSGEIANGRSNQVCIGPL